MVMSRWHTFYFYLKIGVSGHQLDGIISVLLRKYHPDIINGKGMGNGAEPWKAYETNSRPSGMTLLGKWEGGRSFLPRTT